MGIVSLVVGNKAQKRQKNNGSKVFSRGEPKQQAARLNNPGPTNGHNVELRPWMVASIVFQLVYSICIFSHSISWSKTRSVSCCDDIVEETAKFS